MHKNILLFVIFKFASLSFVTASEFDEIHGLPNVSFEVNFKQYSGFLNASDTHFLHYWFVESLNDPAKDPLIFWFNGGPGCSSVLLVLGIGPYKINSNGEKLLKNPNSWTKFANVVFIDAPAGVGYSYASDGNVTTDDDQSAEENYNAIKHFFCKFPQFRLSQTFIFGGSYAGISIPMLAARISDGQNEFAINLQGIGIGNGILSEKERRNAIVYFAYGHGFIGEELWASLWAACCPNSTHTCDFVPPKSAECAEKMSKVMEFQSSGVNVYNVYRTCKLTSKLSPNSTISKLNGTSLDDNAEKTDVKKVSEQCSSPSNASVYLNDEKVRKSLHIPQHLPIWSECVNLDYDNLHNDVTSFVQKILNANVRILLYYGVMDSLCHFLHGQKFAAKLGFKQISESRPWYYLDEFAGFATVYEKGLTFLTVNGAGHSAGEKVPQVTYAVRQFLLNQPI